MDVRKNRAFTLIELLAVMVIIGIIMTLAIPTVRNITYSSSVKECNYHLKLVHEAAKLYTRTYKADIDKTNSECINIPYKELIREGLIEEENILCEGNIILEKRNTTGYNYKYYMNCYDGEVLVYNSDLGGLPLACQGVNGDFKVNYALYTDSAGTIPYNEIDYVQYVHARYNSSSPYNYPIEKIQYSTDFINWKNTETINTHKYTNLDGESLVRAIDSAGNVSDLTKHIVKADSKIPKTNITVKKAISGTSVATDTWSNEALKITFSKTTGVSGATTYYCTDTNNSCVPTTAYTDGVTVNTEGISYIRYYSKSGTGVDETPVQSYTAKIDAQTPVTTITAKKATAGTTVSSGSWSNQNLSVTLAKTAGTSGAKIYYCTDTANTCTPTTEYSSAFTVSTTGTSYVRYYTKSTSGVSETVKSYTAKVDTQTPVTTITAKKATAGTAVSSGSWSSENLTITLTKTAGKSGAKIYYCTDTANTCTPTTEYSSAFTVSTAGTSYIRYYSKSGSGISETTKSYTAKIDTKTPTITAKSNPINLGANSYTFTNNVTVTYGVAGGTTTCDPASSGSTGTYTVKCTAKGNNGKTASVSFSAKQLQTEYNYAYNGTDGTDGSSQTWTTPYTGTYKIEAWGAQGGGTYGGFGAYTRGTIYLTKGQVLYMYIGGSPKVAGGGYNGGGTPGPSSKQWYAERAGGGGSTDIRTVNEQSAYAWKRRIMVAAGGGAAGHSPDGYYYGAGGTLYGVDGYYDSSIVCENGDGWTNFPSGCFAWNSTGGKPHGGGRSCKTTVNNYSNVWYVSGAGQFYQGGGYTSSCVDDYCEWDFGGGGGWYGGGAGTATTDVAAGGSGGSSFISGHEGCVAVNGDMADIGNVSMTGLSFTDTKMELGARSGHGKIKITLLSVD